ncbi:MAG: TlyA family RNA methyltransferase [Deltaproteobacteria bacterium]|nr:TlyA family RNA methyltransferase [Deltaproteobacteria bacterium]
MKRKLRLDEAVVEAGLCDDVQQARGFILAGSVLVDDRPVDKAGTMVKAGARLRVKGHRHGFVSRGGVKLDGALERLGLDPQGRSALDIGAATGGFTDALLQRGAVAVTAVDVGYGLLADGLRRDPRVTVLERTNARTLQPDALPYLPSWVVVDASFISLRLLLPAIARCAAPDALLLAMVKPQFELPANDVPEGGVVRDESARQAAADAVAAEAAEFGFVERGRCDSPLAGPAGNVEIFLRLERGTP